MTALLDRDDPARSEGRTRLVLPQPDLAAYERASDKARLTALAVEAGVPVPEQILVGPDGEASAARFADRVGWPVILKPSRSAVLDGNRIIRTGVETAENRQALGPALDRIPSQGFPVLVQRRVTGPGLGIFLFAIDGEVAAWFAHHRIREKPPTGGVSVYRESVGCRPDLAEHSRRLIERLNWTGVAMVEFKEESATGIPYLMEINARFWGSLQLAVDAGVDFPRLLVDATLGGPVESVQPYRVGVRSRWFWGDVDNLLSVLRAPPGFRKLNPSLPSRRRALLRFLLPWRPGDRWEVFRVSDPRPFLNESVTWFANLFQ